MMWMFDKAKSFAQDVSGWTKHDGNAQCGYYGSNYDFSCTGGVGADTSLMFLDAEAFLASDYYTLDDSTIWGTPRLDVQSGETITDMKFELNEEYAKMTGGCVLPGVLVAVFMFVFTLLFFA